jgi:SSS family solute:Na+ symporter
VPYTILIYPFLFVVFPRLWSVSRRHGYITAPDFVRGRFGNRWLALAIAVTGIIATMPYIALQLVGIQVVIAAMGVEAQGVLGDLPLIIAFVILAAFTYTSGLRAPAIIAIVKDLMIYATVIVVVIVVPIELGGYGKIFAAVPAQKLLLAAPKPGNLGLYSGYATLALGSALALFLYPHSITGILSASSRHAVRRNAALLPAYSLLLGLLTLMGFMAIAAGVAALPDFAPYFKQYGSSFAVPALVLHLFPSWFAGFAFAAIGIGALVPAAIMSIAAANIWTRNIYRELIRPDCTPLQEAQMAKWASLVVKFGALLFIIFLPQQYAIQLQLLGGIWIIQTLPAVVLGLYTRWFDGWALFLGWAAGIATGTWMAGTLAFKGSIYPLAVGNLTIPGYAALYSVIVNIAVTIVLTVVVRAVSKSQQPDETSALDYV